MDNLLYALESCGEYFQKSSFTIVDMHKENQPLVYVNRHFTNLTGYPREEILNKNCRFLQGNVSQQQIRKSIKKTLQLGLSSYHDMINFRKNGEVFWNRLCLFPILHEIIGLKYYVGIQIDVSESKGPVTEAQLEALQNENQLSEISHQEIENPLSNLMSSASALKYFSENDPESLKAREEIVKTLVKNVNQITEYVASLPS